MATHTYDVVIIGSGTSAYMAAYPLREAGNTLAIVDDRPFGGTCAMRGCQPKKYLVAAADAVHRASDMAGIGITGSSRIDWPALIASKNAFTDRVPKNTENGFQEAGMATYHGQAEFTGRDRIQVGADTLIGGHFILATGSVPRPLGIPGEALMTTSDDFLDLPEMPKRVVFVGGGYISFEFAHVARQAGAEVTILQRGPQVLTGFEPDLVDALVAASREMGIVIDTDSCVDRIDQTDSGLVAYCEETPEHGYHADVVVHGAGRVPATAGLHLEAADIAATPRGITVNAHLQSTTHPTVYAIGDVAATSVNLATTADEEGAVAAHNILNGNSREPDTRIIPSAVFTLPPMATVGQSESQATTTGRKVKVNTGTMSGWPSSRRIGQRHSMYKVIIDADSKEILGAHLMGYRADETINIFAMAMRFGLTTDRLKEMIWAYPTYTSDLKYMIG